MASKKNAAQKKMFPTETPTPVIVLFAGHFEDFVKKHFKLKGYFSYSEAMHCDGDSDHYLGPISKETEMATEAAGLGFSVDSCSPVDVLIKMVRDEVLPEGNYLIRCY